MVCHDELIAVERGSGEVKRLAQGASRFAGRAYRPDGRNALATVHGGTVRLHGPAAAGEPWGISAEIPLPGSESPKC